MVIIRFGKNLEILVSRSISSCSLCIISPDSYAVMLYSLKIFCIHIVFKLCIIPKSLKLLCCMCLCTSIFHRHILLVMGEKN